MLALVLFLMAPLASAQTFIISDIRVEGLQRISAGSVFAALPVAVGDLVDERAVRAAARGLFATGNFDDIRIGRDGNVLVVVVAERPSITEISIEGNKAIETEALLEGLKGAGLSVGQVFRMNADKNRSWAVKQGMTPISVDCTHKSEDSVPCPRLALDRPESGP